MDHAEALELIELAAVEPGGLDRLMAGDTPESGAVAGHLAGCPACVAELARIGRTTGLVREVVATQPDPALRDRTLAFVREVGRDRSMSTAQAAVPGPVLAAATGAPRPRPWLRALALVAALALAVGLGYAMAIARGPGDQREREVAALQAATIATLRVDGQADARRVQLVATEAGGDATGTLLYSPSSGELVMVAAGLDAPAAGQVYGCWVEVGGERVRIGRMYDGGDLRAWAGPVEGLGDLPANAVFGVSLVPAEGGPGTPVLTGAAEG